MGFASADVVPLPLTAAKVEVRAVDVSPDLLSRARAGDSAALGALARAQIPHVERLLSRMLGPRQDLEDLVQTVLLELCRSLPRFREESLFSTFVGGITVHVARRAMRGTAWDRRRLGLESEPADDRRGRTAEILAALADVPAAAPAELAARIYDVPPKLQAAAARNVFAHLVALEALGAVAAEGPVAPATRFARLR